MMTFSNIHGMLDMSQSEFERMSVSRQADMVQTLFEFALLNNRKRLVEINLTLDHATDWGQYEHLSRWIQQNMQGKVSA